MTLISGICSLLALSLLSPVQSIVSLIALFVSVAITLYSSGFELLGILYILVYVGAIAILFLFILSLLNIEYSYKGTFNKKIVYVLLICLIPLDLLYETFDTIDNINYNIVENINGIYNTSSLQNWDLELTTVGTVFYTEYAIPLVLIAIVLVLSVIGAIAITK
ncbi:NADH dehydrogenase subunit 6 (mitochondrion) [Candida pseudojiufengensis]|uniref:NADH-ubiquinone oxidoreductase chain 6 n=1 Tax=Candida pseudojiufengensis TaxID=497109 RepID=S5U4X1_9ASCO|nr:NADH dehydrogenase subunit 6 [Candida pseudojiufengensis]AGS44146.1 NADH dehydrogenase subunit 6 [Candida pseudojiufengensis]